MKTTTLIKCCESFHLCTVFLNSERIASCFSTFHLLRSVALCSDTLYRFVRSPLCAEFIPFFLLTLEGKIRDEFPLSINNGFSGRLMAQRLLPTAPKQEKKTTLQGLVSPSVSWDNAVVFLIRTPWSGITECRTDSEEEEREDEWASLFYCRDKDEQTSKYG